MNVGECVYILALRTGNIDFILLYESTICVFFLLYQQVLKIDAINKKLCDIMQF